MGRERTRTPVSATGNKKDQTDDGLDTKNKLKTVKFEAPEGNADIELPSDFHCTTKHKSQGVPMTRDFDGLEPSAACAQGHENRRLRSKSLVSRLQRVLPGTARRQEPTLKELLKFKNLLHSEVMELERLVQQPETAQSKLIKFLKSLKK